MREGFNRFLKTRDELSCGFRSPAADEVLASQRGDKATGSDEFLIGSGQGADRWEFTWVTFSSQQCGSVTFVAGILVRRAALLGLGRSKDPRWGGLLGGQSEVKSSII